jgi:transposase
MTRAKLLDKSKDELIDEVLSLHNELAWLKRQIFGQKSERFIPNEEQLSLDLGIEPTEKKVETEHISYTRKREKKIQGHSRGPMPTHLPFKDTIIEPEEDISGCTKIDDEITWEYDYKPGSLFIHRYIRPKYARPECEGVAIGILPPRAIEKGNFGPGFLSQVVIDKYLYHMPLYRQIQKYRNEYDVTFSESTFCDIISHTAFWIESIYDHMKHDILQSTYLQVDETRIPVMIKRKKGKLHKGYFWVYYDPLLKIVLFEYCHSHTQDHPFEFLESFKGTIQIDGYSGYNKVSQRTDIVRASCMDHCRRYFEKSLDYNQTKASYALETMKIWYDFEAEARKEEYTFEQRLSMRQDKIKESMSDFKIWMFEQAQEEVPSSPIRKACEYAIGQWDGFDVYLNDGRIELSNILVENCIRPIAVGRRNYLFKGSEPAAQRAAMIYSIIATAHFHGKNPFDYIKELLTKLPAAKSSEIKKFLPY